MRREKLLSELKSGVTQKHASADITPVGDTHLITGIVRESPVDLEYRRRDNGMGHYDYFVRVKVWCKTKTGLFRFTDIKVAGSQRDMQAKVGITAGVIAEQLCALYGDLSAEPSECAKAAGAHFRELCDHLERNAAEQPSAH